MLRISSSQPLIAEHEQNLFFPVIWIQPKMGENNTPPNEKKPTPKPRCN